MSSDVVDEIFALHLTACIMFFMQIGMVLFALQDNGFSVRWKLKALFLLPVLPFIAFLDVYVRFFRGEFP